MEPTARFLLGLWLSLSDTERQAFQSALANDPFKATSDLRDAINKYCDKEDPIIGWYLQRAANYLYDVDPGEALQIQRAAYEKNNSMFCPPGITRRPVIIQKFDTQMTMLHWFEFQNPNGAIAAIEELRARLSYDLSPATLEQALMDLAQLLGAEGSRPEKELGEGPDDLWLWPESSFVIEAKNENEGTLHKKDAEQLTFSFSWFKRNYPLRREPVPLIVAKVTNSDHHATFPVGSRVLLPVGMQNLLNALQQFYRMFVSKPAEISNPKQVAELQRNLRLTPLQIVSQYTHEIRELRE